MNGQKARLIYTVVGLRNSADLAAVFHCTSTEKSGGRTIELGVEVFDYTGVLENDIAAGEGAVFLSPGDTRTLTTQATVAFAEDNVLNTSNVGQGSARIFATSKNVICLAMIVDAISSPPTSMVMLPVFRTTKQKGI